MEYAITTNHISKTYGKKTVIDDVSMSIPAGEVYGLVGENGAGKTTIMRLITGLAIPNKGDYTLLGANSKTKDIYKAREKLAAIVEAPSLIPTMNAHDNLVFASLYLGLPVDEEKIQHIITTVGLENVGNKKVKNFSLGMRQRIGIGLSLLSEPKMMILDEPMNGLDPEGIAQLRDLLIRLNQEKGITILISSHILSELEKIATMFGIISHGKLVKEISAEQLRNECRNSIEITVDDGEKAEQVFKNMGLVDFKSIGVGDIRVYDENITANDLVVELVKNNVKISGVVTSNETIEEYYLNVMKGVK